MNLILAKERQYIRGSNQYVKRMKYRTFRLRGLLASVCILGVLSYVGNNAFWNSSTKPYTIVDRQIADVKLPNLYKVDAAELSPTPTETPSELESIVAYIARVFEPEGKAVVVRAINCFYSESGLRSKAVGHNTDEVQSTDYGVAQLNDYWQKLTPEEKTDIKANIDKAYRIYKDRGDNFSAWYGELCNK